MMELFLSLGLLMLFGFLVAFTGDYLINWLAAHFEMRRLTKSREDMDDED